jgi:hypothetical protein
VPEPVGSTIKDEPPQYWQEGPLDQLLPPSRLRRKVPLESIEAQMIAGIDHQGTIERRSGGELVNRCPGLAAVDALENSRVSGRENDFRADWIEDDDVEVGGGSPMWVQVVPKSVPRRIRDSPMTGWAAFRTGKWVELAVPVT